MFRRSKGLLPNKSILVFKGAILSSHSVVQQEVEDPLL